MRVLNELDISSALAPYKGQKIVFTNGCFDLLHIGHVKYLQEAKSLGDLLFVGINSNASVKRLKGPSRPIQDQKDRAEILAALRCVDFVSIFEQDTPYELIKLVHPAVLVKGGDWAIESIVGFDLVTSWGGLVYSLQFVDGKSTTSLIQKAQNQ